MSKSEIAFWVFFGGPLAIVIWGGAIWFVRWLLTTDDSP